MTETNMSGLTKYFTAEPQLTLEAGKPSDSTAYILAYRTVGSKDNPAILIPSCYGGHIENTIPCLWSSDDGKDPVLKDYFVIICGLLGGSESSSPSNAHTSMRGTAFPKPSYEDNVRLQYALCQALGVKKLAAYIGFSMGGQQAYHMAMIYPDFAERIVPIASSARTSWQNWSFLEGPRAALVNSSDWHGGNYTEPARRGTAAFSRVYSTWALAHEWYRQETWKSLGFDTLEDYIRHGETNGMGAWDGNDLLCLMQTWQRGDISLYGPEKGNLAAALASIKAKVLVMPSKTDMYFPPEDSEEEVKHLAHGELCVIPSIWGHCGGNGSSCESDKEFIRSNVARFLEA